MYRSRVTRVFASSPWNLGRYPSVFGLTSRAFPRVRAEFNFVYSQRTLRCYRDAGWVFKALYFGLIAAVDLALNTISSSRLRRRARQRYLQSFTDRNTIDRTCTYDIARMARRRPFNDADDNGNESVTALERIENVSLCIYIEIVCHRYLIKCANGRISASRLLRSFRTDIYIYFQTI